MLTAERHDYILNKLRETGIVRLQELVNELNCSESTIRRDLTYLETKGLLKRIHGGAKRLYTVEEELTIKQKSVKNVHEKQLIGKLAASLVTDQDVIFIDAGTTTLEMIQYLPMKKDITVVTNGIHQATLLTDLGIRTYLVGGRLKNTTKAIIGASAIAQIRSYQFNKCFLGINGIDTEFGFTTPDPEEAAVKHAALRRSAHPFFLADYSKFEKVNFAKVCDLDDATIITAGINEKNRSRYQKFTTVLEAKE